MSRSKRNIAGDEDLASVHTKLDELFAIVNDLKKAVEFISDKHDTIVSKIDSIIEKQKENSKHIDENRKQIEKLSLENELLNRQTKKLQADINAMEQYSRRENIEIHGVDFKPHEELATIVSEIAESLHLPLPVDSIVAAHRLFPPKKNTKNRPAPIIMRFQNRKLADQWLAKRKTGIVSKNILKDGSDTPIFINENLTPINKELYWQARVKGKELKYKFIWVKHGNVYMKKNEESNVMKINNHNDIPKS